jgi:hypothetical protein
MPIPACARSSYIAREHSSSTAGRSRVAGAVGKFLAPNKLTNVWVIRTVSTLPEGLKRELQTDLGILGGAILTNSVGHCFEGCTTSADTGT